MKSRRRSRPHAISCLHKISRRAPSWRAHWSSASLYIVQHGVTKLCTISSPEVRLIAGFGTSGCLAVRLGCGVGCDLVRCVGWWHNWVPPAQPGLAPHTLLPCQALGRVASAGRLPWRPTRTSVRSSCHSGRVRPLRITDTVCGRGF